MAFGCLHSSDVLIPLIIADLVGRRPSGIEYLVTSPGLFDRR
jgi:hypothetical protein